MEEALSQVEKQYPAPGFLGRLNKICEDKDITMDQLAEIAEVTIPMLKPMPLVNLS
jgi:hypothetical protein